MFVVRQSIVAGVNSILGTYCKGAVGKKGDKILAGRDYLNRQKKTQSVEIAKKKTVGGCFDRDFKMH